jgi:hypothetical protein
VVIKAEAVVVLARDGGIVIIIQTVGAGEDFNELRVIDSALHFGGIV